MTGRNFFAVINEDGAYTPAPDANGIFLLAPNYSVPSSYLKGANVQLITPQSGTAGYLTVTIGGTYVVGDEARITIESNLPSRQKFVKSYVVDVLGGMTNDDIASALADKFSRELNAGLIDYPIASVSVASNVVTITQKGDDKRGLIGTTYTDSTLGTIVNVPTPTVISEGQPSDLVDRGIDSSVINLAEYDTVKIELSIEVAQPFIDSKGAVVKELFWYGDPVGTVSPRGAALKTAIEAL